MTSTLLFIINGIKLPDIDVYTGKILNKCDLSREHLIPKKFFRRSQHANHPFNIVPCHRYINNRRSDFRLGDLYISKRLNSFDYEPIHVSSDLTVGIVNKKRRVFYPSPNANKGMIGRNCLIVLHSYDYLYDYLDQIIEDPTLLHVWKNYPESEYERLLKMHFDKSK